MEALRELLEAVNNLRYLVARGSEVAEAKLAEIEDRMRAAEKAGISAELLLLGPFVAEGVGLILLGEDDRVAQIVLLGDRGVGVLLWKRRDFMAAQEVDGPDKPGELLFVAMQECTPLIQTVLLPHIGDMLKQIDEEIRIRTPHTEG